MPSEVEASQQVHGLRSLDSRSLSRGSEAIEGPVGMTVFEDLRTYFTENVHSTPPLSSRQL